MKDDYARIEGGNRIKDKKPFNKKKKFSMLSAISIIGIIDFLYVELSVNTAIFLHFITKQLCPKLKKEQIVIMDNVSFHKSLEVRHAIEETGAKLVFLPPYSPELSPIEKMWSKIKHYLKKYKARSPKQFHNALVQSINKLNQSDFEEWYDACGYEIV